ncbi:MAG: hypothetical protein WBY01_21960 [Pseudolabrys sp.]
MAQMIRAWQSKHRGRRHWRPWKAELYPGARVGLAQAGNLGDVVHTLPMAGAIKAACPTATIVFIARRYTESLVRASRYVDEFFDAELAKRDADAVTQQLATVERAFRFTSKANIEATQTDVRFVPIADMPQFTRSPRPRAMSVLGTLRPSALAVLRLMYS